METYNLTKFPPPRGRIPNFKGAEKACRKLLEIKEFWRTEGVFSAPDSVLRKAREICLEKGKTLLIAKPHLKGFLLLKNTEPKRSSTISGMMKYGVEVSIPSIDIRIGLFLQGCVAVDVYGNRIGKGKGYGDEEFRMLERAGLITENCPVVVIAHDVQVFDDLSYLVDKRDVPADIILTPTRIIRVKR